jgi:hypothetical protein
MPRPSPSAPAAGRSASSSRRLRYERMPRVLVVAAVAMPMGRHRPRRPTASSPFDVESPEMKTQRPRAIERLGRQTLAIRSASQQGRAKCRSQLVRLSSKFQSPAAANRIGARSAICANADLVWRAVDIDRCTTTAGFPQRNLRTNGSRARRDRRIRITLCISGGSGMCRGAGRACAARAGSPSSL